MPTTYVSTACRLDRHQECEDHPVVFCACPCHGGRLQVPRADRILRANEVDSSSIGTSPGGGAPRERPTDQR